MDLLPAKPQVYGKLYILDEKVSTFDRPGLKYMARFIFWVEKQIFSTGQALNI